MDIWEHTHTHTQIHAHVRAHRWQVIADYINQHIGGAGTATKSADEVVAKVKLLKKMG